MLNKKMCAFLLQISTKIPIPKTPNTGESIEAQKVWTVGGGPHPKQKGSWCWIWITRFYNLVLIESKQNEWNNQSLDSFCRTGETETAKERDANIGHLRFSS